MTAGEFVFGFYGVMNSRKVQLVPYHSATNEIVKKMNSKTVSVSGQLINADYRD